MNSTLPIVEHLFNFFLTYGVFPKQWKLVLICPIHKIKNAISVQHYRPISILPALSKVLERVVCDQIREYLEDSGLYDPCQSAYRNNNSTQTCLIQVLDEARSGQKDGYRVVFFDFSKASDSILRWMHLYLTERTQAIRDGAEGVISSRSRVGAGMPQGSVLGPLLFTLYLSDFGPVLQAL